MTSVERTYGTYCFSDIEAGATNGVYFLGFYWDGRRTTYPHGFFWISDTASHMHISSIDVSDIHGRDNFGLDRYSLT